MPVTRGSSPATSMLVWAIPQARRPRGRAAQALEIQVGLRISRRGWRTSQTPGKSRVLLTYAAGRCNIGNPFCIWQKLRRSPRKITRDKYCPQADNDALTAYGSDRKLMRQPAGGEFDARTHVNDRDFSLSGAGGM